MAALNKDTARYRDPLARLEYSRKWQERYRATHRHQIAENVRAKRERDKIRTEKRAYKSFEAFFNSEDGARIVGFDDVYNPWFKIQHGGKVVIERFSEPFPTW